MTAKHPGLLTDEQHGVVTASAAETEAVAALTELKQKLLDHGPDAVTAQELADAAARVEHAKLTVEHAAQVAEAAAKRQRLEELEEEKAGYLARAGSPEDALAAMRQIEEGVAYLVKYGTDRQGLISDGLRTLLRAKVPAVAVGQQQEDGHAGLGWDNGGLDGGDGIVIDGRRIGTLNPALLISAAIARGCRKANRSALFLSPVLQVDVDSAIVTDPETWLSRRY